MKMNLFICILAVSLPAYVFGDCGRNYEVNRVGAGEARPNSWPWQVSLQYLANDVEYPVGHWCGGSIVAPGWILSAATCFLDAWNASKWTVVAGEHDLEKRSGREQVRSVVQIIRHPYYCGLRSPFDMVLTKLNQSLQYNAYVQPICLPPQGISEDLQQRTCMLTGWGPTIAQAGSRNSRFKIQDSKFKIQDFKNSTGFIQILRNHTKLQQVGGPIVSPAACRGVWGELMVSQHICFAVSGLNDGCDGDGGGPLVCRSQAGQWIQFGVLAGVPCKVRGSLFTRVSSLTNWIQSYIA